MTEVASGVQASASKLVIISKRFCFKYLASAARRSQIWLPHCLLPCFSLIFASLRWSCFLAAAPVPCPRAVWNTGPAFTLLLCFSWINIAEIAFLRERKNKQTNKKTFSFMVQWEHISSILLWQKIQTNVCISFCLVLKIFRFYSYSLSVKLSQGLVSLKISCRNRKPMWLKCNCFKNKTLSQHIKSWLICRNWFVFEGSTWTHPRLVTRCPDLQEDALGEPLEMAFGEGH